MAVFFSKYSYLFLKMRASSTTAMELFQIFAIVGRTEYFDFKTG